MDPAHTQASIHIELVRTCWVVQPIPRLVRNLLGVTAHTQDCGKPTGGSSPFTGFNSHIACGEPDGGSSPYTGLYPHIACGEPAGGSSPYTGFYPHIACGETAGGVQPINRVLTTYSLLRTFILFIVLILYKPFIFIISYIH